MEKFSIATKVKFKLTLSLIASIIGKVASNAFALVFGPNSLAGIVNATVGG